MSEGRFKKIALAAALALGSSPANAGEFRADRGGRPIFSATLNGQQESCLFGSGANAAVVSEGLARRLNLSITGREQLTTAGQTEANYARIETVEVDGVQQENVRTIVLAQHQGLTGVECILGTNMLTDGNSGGKLTLNFGTSQYQMQGGGNCETGRGRHCVEGESRISPTAPERRLPFVRVRINGVEALALIDTGSATTRVNPALAERLRNPGMVRRGVTFRDLPANVQTPSSTEMVQMPSIAIGETQIERVAAAVESDLPLFRQEDGTLVPGLIIGTRELSQFESISIDFTNPTRPVIEFVERPDRVQVAERE